MFVSIGEEILTQARSHITVLPEDHLSRSPPGQPRSGTMVERSAMAITCPNPWAHRPRATAWPPRPLDGGQACLASPTLARRQQVVEQIES
jgi:hypothetical protein